MVNIHEVQFFKGVFFFFGTILLLSMFLLTLIQGILVHLEGNTLNAFYFYLISMLCVGTAIRVYKIGEKIIQLVNYSK